jgi:hypothetical protein
MIIIIFKKFNFFFFKKKKGYFGDGKLNGIGKYFKREVSMEFDRKSEEKKFETKYFMHYGFFEDSKP